MANNNGIIYKNGSSSPPLGVETADLQDVLGTSKNDIGQIVTDADIDINKWAKYKPLRSDKLGILTDAERAELNHGLVINKYNSISGIEGASGDWVYQRPRGKGNGAGGADEWFRHDDFAHESQDLRGFNANARCFVESTQIPERYVKGGGGITFRLTVTPASQLPIDSLYLTDFYDLDGYQLDLSELYLGVLIKGKKSNTDAYVYLTSSDALDEYDSEVTFDENTIDAFDAGVCNVYLIAVATQCATPQTNTGDINSTYLRQGAFVLPNVPMQTFTIAVNESSMVIYKLDVTERTGGLSIVTDVKYRGAFSGATVSNVNIKFYTNTGAGGEDEIIGRTGGYGGYDPNSQNERTGWVLPNDRVHTYYEDYGNYYQSISLNTTYGSYVKAVLTYQIDVRTLTYTMVRHIGGFDPTPPTPVVD